MSYDFKCSSLARQFLSDVGEDQNEALVKELAQVIQDAIEEFFADNGLAS